MQIRFGCHICGQAVSGTLPGSEVRCPKCKRLIIVPIWSTLAAPIPDVPPYHHRAENVQGPLLNRVNTGPRKMFQKIAAISLIAIGACFVYASQIAPRPAAPPQTQTYTTAVLKCPTTFQLRNRNVTLPRGSQVEFLSSDASQVRVRYRGHEQSLAASDVDLR
jgi:hypothetical protein